MDTLFDFSAIRFFSVYGLAAVILSVVPNFFFASREQNERLDDVDTCGAGICFMEFFSRIILTVVLIFVRTPRLSANFAIAAAVCLVIYYILWLRYFKTGCYYPGIYTRSFLGIPVPFAFANVLYMIFVALWLGNGIALCVIMLYGTCHLMNAFVARRDLKSRGF